MARTNVVKRDADDWISNMEQEMIGSYDNNGDHGDDHMRES